MSDNETDLVASALSPSTIEGRDPGSIYHVVVRTKTGYVAVRRIAEKVVRIRAERFDKTLMFNPENVKAVEYLAQMGLAPAGSGGSRLSTTVYGNEKARMIIGVLAGALMLKEFAIDIFPTQEEPGAQAWQDAVEKKIAEAEAAQENAVPAEAEGESAESEASTAEESDVPVTPPAGENKPN
jgi:hypothetical protein